MGRTGSAKSKLEERFYLQLRARPEIPMAEREFYFAKSLRSPKGRPRMWRFDFAWPESKVALELQGGIWTGGKHARGAGLVKDYEKANAAALLGWRLLYADASMVRNYSIIDVIEQVLCPEAG